MSTAYIRCPHCGGKMTTARHRQMNELLKELTATCRNADCLFSASVYVEIARQIQPSLAPKPEITGQLLKGQPR